MRVLLAGLYDQGNLGDDLMAVMFAELVSSLGAEPIILTRSPRFVALGYTTAECAQRARFDAVLFAGGAFFKAASASKPASEAQFEKLSAVLRGTNAPIICTSLGSDGIDHLDNLSPARRSIVELPQLRTVAVRLRSDLALGLPKSVFLPDIVLATRYFRSIWGGRIHSDVTDPRYLVNLSRRSIAALPTAFQLTRDAGLRIFLAHAPSIATGGEITLPFLARYAAEDMAGAIDAIEASRGMISSKLHPGIMALSLGRPFLSVRGRPKTRAFIEEYRDEGLITTRAAAHQSTWIETAIDLDWQIRLWNSYRDFLGASLELGGGVGVKGWG